MSLLVTLFLTCFLVSASLTEDGKLSSLVRMTRVRSGYTASSLEQELRVTQSALKTLHYPVQWRKRVLEYISSTYGIVNLARQSVRTIFRCPFSIDSFHACFNRLLDRIRDELKWFIPLSPQSGQAVLLRFDQLKSACKQARKRSSSPAEIIESVAIDLRHFFGALIKAFDEIADDLEAELKSFPANAHQVAASLFIFHRLLMGDMEIADAVDVKNDSSYHKAIVARLRPPKVTAEFVVDQYRQRELSWFIFYGEMRKTSLFSTLVNFACMASTRVRGREFTHLPEYLALSDAHSNAKLIVEASVSGRQAAYGALREVVASSLWSSKSPAIRNRQRLVVDAAAYFSSRPICFKNKKTEDDLFYKMIL